jgi:hypothetical protein
MRDSGFGIRDSGFEFDTPSPLEGEGRGEGCSAALIAKLETIAVFLKNPSP